MIHQGLHVRIVGQKSPSSPVVEFNRVEIILYRKIRDEGRFLKNQTSDIG